MECCPLGTGRLQPLGQQRQEAHVKRSHRPQRLRQCPVSSRLVLVLVLNQPLAVTHGARLYLLNRELDLVSLFDLECRPDFLWDRYLPPLSEIGITLQLILLGHYREYASQ